MNHVTVTQIRGAMKKLALESRDLTIDPKQPQARNPTFRKLAARLLATSRDRNTHVEAG